MQKHDLAPINDELKKAVEGAENTLVKEVGNLTLRFREYQDEVEKMRQLSELTDLELEKLRLALDSMTKAYTLIKQILVSGGSSDEKVAMMLKVVE